MGRFKIYTEAAKRVFFGPESVVAHDLGSVFRREHGPSPLVILAVTAAFLALAGCSPSRIVTLAPTPLADRFPQHLLTCADRPAPGSLELQSDVASFVVDLDGAGEDCRRKLGAVRGIVEAETTEGEVK